MVKLLSATRANAKLRILWPFSKLKGVDLATSPFIIYMCVEII